MFIRPSVRWITLAGYTGAILFLLWTPAAATVGAYDKLGHVALFSAFSWLIWWCLDGPKIKRILTAASAATAVAMISEYGQIFVATRRFELGDLVADGVGIVLGLLMVAWRRKPTPILANPSPKPEP